MTPEQERAEARIDKAKLLEWMRHRIRTFMQSPITTKVLSDVIDEIETKRFDINSLDREEQLIAENEQLKNSVRYWQEDAKRSDEHGCRASAKVAEQDKEIQRLKELLIQANTKLFPKIQS